MIANEEMSMNSLNLLRQCLNQLGATPTSASNVSQQDEGTDDDDPSSKYF
jgi:hypothetical protein